MFAPSRDDDATPGRGPSGVYPFLRFAAEHMALGRDAFLARVRTAHLLVWTPLDAPTDASFGTIVSRPARGAAAAIPAGVAPLEKRAGGNPFALMITLGRAANNDVVLNHSALSKFHAYLRRSGDGWVLDDAGSTNGSVVNGARVERGRSVAVPSGARITLGGEVELELLEPPDLWARLRGGGRRSSA